jgi:Putative auto-transporter adhesin, head GIN domain
MFFARLALIALVALVAAGCGIGDDGPRTSQTRDVAGFTRIENDGSVDVRLRVGERQRVRVYAGENVIDDVGTEVRDGTLHVTFDHDGFGGRDVEVEATVPRLTAVGAGGSGDIDAAGIDAGTFELINDGSATVELRGTAERLLVDLDGSGDAELGSLAAREARVSVSGSGDVEVSADRRLEIDVEGSGDVSYSGDPELSQSVDGSGEVSRAN